MSGGADITTPGVSARAGASRVGALSAAGGANNTGMNGASGGVAGTGTATRTSNASMTKCAAADTTVMRRDAAPGARGNTSRSPMHGGVSMKGAHSYPVTHWR
jgi:hypothetical protein